MLETEIPILTCSADDYAKNHRANISSYHLVGPIWAQDENLVAAENRMRTSALEKGCEALVATRYALASANSNGKVTLIRHVSGTGLKRKTEAEEKAEEEK